MLLTAFIQMIRDCIYFTIDTLIRKRWKYKYNFLNGLEYIHQKTIIQMFYILIYSDLIQ